MLNPLFAVASWLTEMLISYFFLGSVTQKKHSALLCGGIGAGLFVCGALVNLLTGNRVLINSVTSVLVHFLFCRLCFTADLRKSVFYTLFMNLLIFAAQGMIILLVSAIESAQPLDYNQDSTLLLLECPASYALYFAACCIAVRWLHPKGSSQSIPLVFLFYPCASLATLLICIWVCIIERLGSVSQILLAVVNLVMLAATLLLILFYQYRSQADAEAARMAEELRQVQLEKSYYALLRQQNEDLKICLHDVKKHLAVIELLNDSKNVQQYTAAFSAELDSYARGGQSGNKLLDVILNKYEMICRRQGIRLTYDVRANNLKILADVDLIAVLGNLMDNAVTAAAASDEKSIDLETFNRGHFTVLVLRNSCDREPTEESGHLLSTKEDGKKHGYGIQSVKRALTRYGGDLGWEYNRTTRQFVATAMLSEISSTKTQEGTP